MKKTITRIILVCFALTFLFILPQMEVNAEKSPKMSIEFDYPSRVPYLEDKNIDLGIENLDYSSKNKFKWSLTSDSKKYAAIDGLTNCSTVALKLKKTGKITVKCKVTSNGKTTTLSKSFTIRKANALKSLKLNGKSYIKSMGTDNYTTIFSNAKKLKLSLSANSGWKIKSICYDGFTKKIKNKASVKNKKYGIDYYITMYNKTQNTTMEYTVSVITYKTKKAITYGKPKSGTKLILERKGRMDASSSFQYTFKYQKKSNSNIKVSNYYPSDRLGEVIFKYTAYFNSSKDLADKINQTYYKNSAVAKGNKVTVYIPKGEKKSSWKVTKGNGMKVK